MLLTIALALTFAGLASCILAAIEPKNVELVPGSFLLRGIAFTAGVAMTMGGVGWLASLILGGT